MLAKSAQLAGASSGSGTIWLLLGLALLAALGFFLFQAVSTSRSRRSQGGEW